ncbi:MAG: LysM peptidoglycan-binding domain-containing M23 family metallopeptidase [Alphaproteobacteria bacterium]|nr:LysM peptidoglycan-binding domain-containing M23 family metallopeptidase [Alphaproteobacteria bacterium]
MNNRVCYLQFVIFCMLLSACDLQSKIADAVGLEREVYRSDGLSSGIQSVTIPEYGTNIESLYGTNIDNVYGRVEPEYASAKDYIAPEPPPQKRVETEKPKTEPVPPVVPIQPPSQSAQPKPVSVPVPQEPDDLLLVPSRPAAKPTVVESTTGEIIVQRGDTVFSISQKHKVPLRDLVEENKIAPPYILAVGRKLRLPGAKYHTVVSGETLYSISRAHSVDLNSLARENNIQAPYGLSVGQKLRLPASVASSAPIPEKQATSVEKPKTEDKKTTPVAVTKTGTSPPAAPVVSAPPPRQSSAPTGKLPVAASRSGAKFSWPIQGRILSDFGAKKNGLYNDGINIGAARGTAVKAAENGVVAYAGNELKGMGNLVIVQHSGGWMTVYAHLDSMNVRRGARVAVGEKIGTVGSTGKVTEPQLHFEIRNGTKAYNPRAQLKK